MPASAPVICIPARLESQRLPQKLLLDESGIPLLIHTCQQAAEAFGQEAVLVCADHPRLIDLAHTYGFQALLTDPQHQSGTDRIAEAAASLSQEIVINVQGDEPEIDPAHIRCLADLLEQHAWAEMATLATPEGAASQNDPNAVKVLVSPGQRALFFSRAPLVWDRDAARPRASCLRHIGIYAYRRRFLLAYQDLPRSCLEQSEKLEQLRALEAGHGIACAIVEGAAAGIDCRSDYDAFLQRQRTQEK